jgi:hypothetical protein
MRECKFLLDDILNLEESGPECFVLEDLPRANWGDIDLLGIQWFPCVPLWTYRKSNEEAIGQAIHTSHLNAKNM